ncbi:MAG: DoxX family protein [Culturomica sp.]|jgi:uncharacterized membrane protein YphA (DoxX/SURF4 family)|nr:DoxX family protein [Culturomica sp.]
MKLLANIFRIIVGAVFIFSGFAKGVDPLGSTYKFIDYFNAFGMSWLDFTALFGSFFMSLLEFLVGVCLFLNIKIRTASWGALIFMLFFTPLTLILAIKNPVTDCGCFGDAWILTNWETFWKNVILLAMILVIFNKRKNFKSIFNFLEQTVIVVFTAVLMFSLEVHCYRHLPVVDFRPYSVGKDIQAGMTAPEGAPVDEYKITLTYKNKTTGETQDFDETNYPWQDTVNWEFHSSSQKLVSEGYKTPIHDFVIEHPVSGDITEDILTDDNYTFFVVSYNLEKANNKYWDDLNKLAHLAQEKNYNFYGLTASNRDEIKKVTDKYSLPFEFCSTDEIQLKTIVRSNPGLVLMKKGVVIGKWGHRDLPKPEELQNGELLSYTINNMRSDNERYIIYIFILSYFALLFAYMIRKYSKIR